MADATTMSRISLLQEKPSLLSSNILCPHKHLLCALLDRNDSTLKSNSKSYSQFRQLPFGTVASPSSSTLLNWVVSHRPGREGRVHASSRSSSSRADGESDLPPSSKEETLQQAGEALLLLLEKTFKQQGPTTVKKKKLQRQVRLRVDIPVLDDSPQVLFTLAQDLLDSFLGGGKNIPGKVAIYFSDSALLDRIALSTSATFHSLETSEELPKDAVVGFVIAPRFEQVKSLDSVIRNAGVRPVIVVNPEWSEEEEQDKTWGAFLASFGSAYSFIPLNIQGFFSKTEGAVLRRSRSGAPGEQPWLIYVKDGDTYKCVSRLKKRPTPTDLENALYSSMAANSPVNKSIAFLRGLVSK